MTPLSLLPFVSPNNDKRFFYDVKGRSGLLDTHDFSLDVVTPIFFKSFFRFVPSCLSSCSTPSTLLFGILTQFRLIREECARVSEVQPPSSSILRLRISSTTRFDLLFLSPSRTTSSTFLDLLRLVGGVLVSRNVSTTFVHVLIDRDDRRVVVPIR